MLLEPPELDPPDVDVPDPDEDSGPAVVAEDPVVAVAVVGPTVVCEPAEAPTPVVFAEVVATADAGSSSPQPGPMAANASPNAGPAPYNRKEDLLDTGGVYRGAQPMSASEAGTIDDATLTRQLARLREAVPDPHCELDHRNPFELLIATILSAQCTDKLVNTVTPALFEAFPDAAALAAAPIDRVQELIGRVSMYRNKSRYITQTAAWLAEHHGGELPRTVKEMIKLPGVARKTANLVLGTGLGITTGIVVDTHVERVANRLGFVQAKGAVKVERALMERIERDRWIPFAHEMILFGRRVCNAKRPKCESCGLAPDCPSRQVG